MTRREFEIRIDRFTTFEHRMFHRCVDTDAMRIGLTDALNLFEERMRKYDKKFPNVRKVWLSRITKRW